jgi:poly(ADP-ribose) glycohydrolase ARH3
MRISPVGVTFRNATEAELLEATTQAIVSSHVHPEAIDGAFVQAYAITLLLKLDNPSELTPEAFLTTLHDTSKNQTVAAEILLVKQVRTPSVHISPLRSYSLPHRVLL